MDCSSRERRLGTAMKLSTKGRYAMVALADLALAEAQAGDDLVSLAEIAKRQDISLPYLEQLFVKLRRAGLVEAVRGPGGGYQLARAADAIRISRGDGGGRGNGGRACTPGRGPSGGVSGTRAQSPDQPAVGRPVGAMSMCSCTRRGCRTWSATS